LQSAANLVVNVNMPEALEIGLNQAIRSDYREVLTPAALQFLARLAQRFATQPPIEPLPGESALWQPRQNARAQLQRYVQIVVPPYDRLLIQAHNSGAATVVADFSTFLVPTWDHLIVGQLHLHAAVHHRLECATATGKVLRQNRQGAEFAVRPRDWHAADKHFQFQKTALAAPLVDFGLYVFNNAHELIRRQQPINIALSKVGSANQAKLWAEVFAFSIEHLQLPADAICCSVLLDSIEAVLDCESIIYQLRDFIYGLTLDRWAYLRSLAQLPDQQSEWFLINRSELTLQSAFLKSYVQRCAYFAHRHNLSFCGDWHGETPREDPLQHAAMSAALCEAIEQEITDLADGTQLAHPALAPVAHGVFRRQIQAPQQLRRKLKTAPESTALLLGTRGEITRNNVCKDIGMAIHYVSQWLQGEAYVNFDQRIVGAAEIEFIRQQLWLWVHHPEAQFTDGRKITAEVFRECLDQERESIKQQLGREAYQARSYPQAARIFDEAVLSDTLNDSITRSAARRLAL
jgi:malate synthase